LPDLSRGWDGRRQDELSFNAAGNIIDSRVLSGPEELRQAALESAIRRNYSINVARTLQVLVEFRLADAPRYAGGVLVPPPPPPPPPPPFEAIRRAILDRLEIRGVADRQAADLRQRLGLSEGQPIPMDISDSRIKSAAEASGIRLPLTGVSVRGIGENRVGLYLTFGSAANPTGTGVQTPFGVKAAPGTPATPFGVVGGPARTLAPVTKVDALYPPLARQARVQGIVVMQADINPDGSLKSVRVVNGHPLLIQAAVEAVKQWRYEPQAEAVTTMVTIDFKL
jgi:protein TonB